MAFSLIVFGHSDLFFASHDFGARFPTMHGFALWACLCVLCTDSKLERNGNHWNEVQQCCPIQIWKCVKASHPCTTHVLTVQHPSRGSLIWCTFGPQFVKREKNLVGVLAFLRPWVPCYLWATRWVLSFTTKLTWRNKYEEMHQTGSINRRVFVTWSSVTSSQCWLVLFCVTSLFLASLFPVAFDCVSGRSDRQHEQKRET